MENLSIFIPMDRRHALAQRELLPDRSTGAALFADISGFTPLTEALTRKYGPQRGAEELTRHLNEAYDALIAQVDQYGGSVVGFSGDAITCWFDLDDGQRATASALAMQDALRHFANIEVSAREAVTLTVKVAITVGPVRRFSVGDPATRHLDTLAGATLDRLAATEHHSQKGEVVVDAATASSLGEKLSVREWREAEGERYAIVDALTSAVPPCPWPPLPPDVLSDDQIRPWLVSYVYERLESGQEEFLAELRPGVSLFVHFGGINYDGDDRAEEKLDAYIRWVQTVLNRYEGTLVELTIGDKGSYLNTTFGAPIAHDDDPARALAAALELRVLPASMQFIHPVRLGISAGRMRVGPYGGKTRYTYGMQGDEVNLAARLMQYAADRQIVVSPRVVQATSHRYDFRTLGSAQLKGKERPVELFELVGLRAAPARDGGVSTPERRQSPIVGRTAERGQLRRHLDRLLDDRAGGLVLIEGEAGIGKSRLVQELIEQAHVRGATRILGAGDAIERATLYHAWRPVLTELLGLDGLPDDPELRRTHVLEWLEGDGTEPSLAPLAPLLTTLLPLDLPDNETTAVLGGRERAEATRDLLAQILQRAASAMSLVLVIEDAHWLDSASWALVQRVVERVSSLLMVVASRPLGESAPPEFQAIAAAPSAQRLTLGPLESDDVITMVQQRLGVRSLPDQVCELIQERAEGNPFFSEELAYALRDTGIIVIHDGICELAPGAPDLRALDFPDTVQGVITSRIDHLAPQQQLAMKVASVVGRVFAYQVLSEIHPIHEDIPRLVDDLNVLARLDLTPLESPSPDLRYIFKHIITQEVAYNLMLFAQRQRLHRVIGEWYERTYATDLAPYYAVLAHHWTKAVEVPPVEADALAKAMDYSFKAGEQALRNNAHLEAIGHLTKGLELVKTLPESPERDGRELGFQVLVAVPLTLTRGWAAPEVGAAYQRAHELCKKLGETPQLFQALSGVFTYYLVRGQFRQANEMAVTNLEVAEHSGDPELILEASQDRGAALCYIGELEECLPHLKRVGDLYIPDRHFYHVFAYGKNPAAVALLHLALSTCLLGYPDQALEHVNVATSLTKTWPHPFSYLWTLITRAIIHQLRGEVEPMEQVADTVIELSTKQGFPNWLAQGLVYKGWTLACRGQAQMGIDQARQGLALWRMTGSELLRPYLQYLLVDSLVRANQASAAEQALAEALDQAEQSGERWWEPELYRLRGQFRLEQTPSNPDEAEADFQRALALARNQHARALELRAAMSLARLRQTQGRPDEASALLQAVYEWFQEGHTTRDLVQARTLLQSLRSA